MNLRDKFLIGLFLIAAAFAISWPKLDAATDYINVWLRSNVTNSSDGASLLVEFTPNSSLTGDWATTSTVEDVFDIERTSSGTPANGIGTGLTLSTETTVGNVEKGLTIDAAVTDVTGASEDFDFILSLMDGGTAAAERLRIDSGGIITQSGASAATNTVIDFFNLKHNTSDTAADGIGIGMLFTQETAAANDEILASIDVIATDVSDATEDGEIIFSTMTAGAAATEKMRVHDTGEVEFQMGILPDAVTADPCGSGYPEGSIFYNTTANVLCFCDGTNDLKIADGSACF